MQAFGVFCSSFYQLITFNLPAKSQRSISYDNLSVRKAARLDDDPQLEFACRAVMTKSRVRALQNQLLKILK